MTQYFFTLIVCIVAVETFMRLPLKKSIASLHSIISKVTRVLTSSAISDHWKEKVLLRYAGNLAVQTIILAGIFLIGGGIIALTAIILDKTASSSMPLLEFLVTVPGIVTATVVSTIYFMLRKPRGD